jgi:hypothetical protein
MNGVRWYLGTWVLAGALSTCGQHAAEPPLRSPVPAIAPPSSTAPPHPEPVEAPVADPGASIRAAVHDAGENADVPRMRAPEVEEWLVRTTRECNDMLRYSDAGNARPFDLDEARGVLDLCHQHPPRADGRDVHECLGQCWAILFPKGTRGVAAWDQSVYDEALRNCIARVEQTLGHDEPRCRFRGALPPTTPQGANPREQCDLACRGRAMEVRSQWERGP